MIKPQFAGELYEKDYVALMTQLDSLYEHNLGPGDLPTRRRDEKIKGIIVPHYDYNISGPSAAWAYKVLAEHHFPETYVFLVPDHSGSVINYQITLDDFETAFGVCTVDKEFAQALLDTGIVSQSSSFSSQALELQLPLLQHACKDKLKDIKILPIIVPHSNNYEALAEAISRLKRDVVVIAVSNFTCYGPKFLYTPFKYNVEESLENLDMTMLKFILNFDSESLLHYVRKQKNQVSAVHALAVFLKTLSFLDVKDAELLSYYKSSVLTEDEENSISFMSFVF